MKKTKGVAKRLTALFLAVTFLAGTLSAGMNVEAAGKTIYIFNSNCYNKTTEDCLDDVNDYSLSTISEKDIDTSHPYDMYVCDIEQLNDTYISGSLIPRIHFYPNVNAVRWVKLDETKFKGYRFKITQDKSIGSYSQTNQSWIKEKRVNHDFTITVTAPFEKGNNKDKVLYTFTQDDFDKNGYCKITMNLPITKEMSFHPDKIYDREHMYCYTYKPKVNNKDIAISLLPTDEEAFVEYMLRRPDNEYYAKWSQYKIRNAMIQKRSQIVKFPIIYDLDGGKNHKSNPNSYMPKQKVVLKDPSKKGYIFKGWEVTSNDGTVIVSPANILAPGNILKNNTIRKNSYGKACLKAVWEKAPNYYNVSYKLNGGKNNSSNEKTYSSKKGLKLKSPSKKGYSFKGWYYDSAFKSKVKNNTISKGTAGNVKVYAKWKKKTYTIKYVNAGKHRNPKKYTVTSKTIQLKSPKKTGYTFKGWYSDKKCTKKVTKIKKGSTGNKILYAKWQKVKK